MIGTLGFVITLGLVFSVRGSALMEQQLRSRLQQIAAVSAQQFNPKPLERIHSKVDMEKPEFRTVVDQLRGIRDSVTNIRFVYIMRKTNDPKMLQFIADADSLATVEQLDKNMNGVVDEEEEGSYPGEAYSIEGIPALHEEAFTRPTVDAEVTYDQWGALISGYAPIRDGSKTIAVLGIDMDAKEFAELRQSIFSPVLFLLFILAAGFMVGYMLIYMWTRRVEEMRHMEEERTGMLRLTSHQLGELLTIFQWSLEDLHNKDLPQGDHDQALHNVETGVRRLRNILDTLRTAARIDAGIFPFKPEPVYLRDCIMETVHGMSFILQKKNHRIVFALNQDIHLNIDRHLTKDVIHELLQNASDFSEPGKEITVSSSIVSGMAIVSVQDKGCGIPKKDLPRIFSKFVRGSNAHLSRPDGYGLGLFIARRIVERMGGEMWVDSDEGKGTMVSFSLPLNSAFS